MRIPALVPRYDTRGLLSTAFLLGCSVGIVALASSPLISWLQSLPAGMSGSNVLGIVLPLALLLLVWILPPVLFGTALALLTPRRFVVFACGTLAAAGFGLSLIVFGLLIDRDSSAVIDLNNGVMMLAWQGGAAVFNGLLVLGCHQLSRALIFRVFEATPTTCRKCGYDAATDRAEVCPECGTPIESEWYRCRWLHTLTGRARSHIRGLRVAAALVGASIGLAMIALVVMGSTSGFVRQFRGKGDIVGATIYAKGTWPNAPASGAGVILHTSPGSPKVVWVGYLAHDRPGFPAMQLQLQTEMPSLGFGLGKAYSAGGPPIFCDLDRAQAEWVLANGLPQSLMDEMVAASSAWPTSGGSSPTYVDPSPHLGGRTK